MCSFNFIFLGGTRVASFSTLSGSGIPQVMYYHADHLGGTNVLSDSTGLMKELIEYEPYGTESRHDKYGSSEEVAWYYFTGKPKDDETGLYYYGARYYDPKLGRFITADTIVQAPNNPQTLNRYTYCNNNPVNLVDANGHFWFIPFLVAAVKGAVIGATIGAATAAITGGDIGKGALFGAIGGGVFGGLSSAFNSFATFAMTGTTNVSLIGSAARTVGFLGGIVGGAGAGAVGAAYLGTDISEGAGIGALSGGLFGAIGGMKGTGWAGVGRVALAGIAGGGISELAGGSFADGAMFAGIVAGSDFVYRSIVSADPRGHNRGASMKTAKEGGQPKLGVDLTVDGRTSQLNDPDKYSNVGFFSKAGDRGLVNTVAGETGPVMSSLGRFVPGFQGLSLAHDITGAFLSNTFGQTVNSVAFNFQTMPAIYGLNAMGSLINDSPGMIGFYENYRENK